MKETFLEKIKNKFIKKSFFIEFDEYIYAMPTRNGFVKPSNREIQLAIEHYCMKNKHAFEYLSMEEPIVFTLDGKETYHAEAMLVRNRVMSGYVVKCLEV